MNEKLLGELLAAHDAVVAYEGNQLTFNLIEFRDFEMKNVIPNSPFREFESVPQDRQSKRKQNDSFDFDPYNDTVFDYPLIVQRLRGSELDARKYFNWHLTVHIPYCRMKCWHCFNPKGVCATGQFFQIEGQTKSYTAQQLLEAFAEQRRLARSRGKEIRVLRVSGGEPFLAPELVAELLLEIAKYPNADYPDAIWTETNLTTWAETTAGNSLVSEVEKACAARGRPEISTILRNHKDRLIGLPCFHGLSDQNIAEITGLEPGLLTFKDLITAYRKLHGLGLHLYPTFLLEASNPDHVENLFTELFAIHPSYPLKTALISVDYYGASLERHSERASRTGVYGRFACLNRWRRLIRLYYGVDYGQIPRPFAEYMTTFPVPVAVSSNVTAYSPLVLMLKSAYRPEYRQELLTILGAPLNTRVRESYDCKHVEESLLDRLKVETKSFCEKCSDVLIVYATHRSREWDSSCVPLRMAKITEIAITETVVSFEMVMGPFVVPESENSQETGRYLPAFRERLRDYFGDSLLVSDGRKWVMLGEVLLLESQSDEPSLTTDETPAGWEKLLRVLNDENITELVEDANVFLQLLPPESPGTSKTEVLSFTMIEGDKLDFQVNFRIPKFSPYQNPDTRDTMNAGRTVCIRSSSDALSVRGYHPRPLAKYGSFGFQLSCGELDSDQPAQVIIEAEDQSPYCPRYTLDLSLKKANASE